MDETHGQYPLITIEGPDFSGKTSLTKFLAEALGAALLVFPTQDGEVGKLIRRAFASEIKLSPQTLGYLMVADGLDQEARIKELLENQPVVMDRHTTVSGWVYQTAVYSVDAVLAIQQRGQFRTPDVVFVLDVPEEVTLARMESRAALNPLYEKKDLAHLTTMRRRYLAYHFMHANTILLDGTKSVEELAETVVGVLHAIGRTVAFASLR